MEGGWIKTESRLNECQGLNPSVGKKFSVLKKNSAMLIQLFKYFMYDYDMFLFISVYAKISQNVPDLNKAVPGMLPKII